MKQQREIKFKFWSKKNKRMIPGEHDIKKGTPMIGDFIWLQYAGFKDKNGKEIYEGDIVRVGWNTEAQPLWVEYQGPSFVMRFMTKSGHKSKSWSTFDLAPSENQSYEVIGNIYQNPELLPHA